MGSTLSGPHHFSRASKGAKKLIDGGTDLRTHHPASAGGTINSMRMAADTVNRVVDTIPSKVDTIISKADTIGFAAKITATFGAAVAIQNTLTQKHIADSLNEIAKDLSSIARRAEIENNSNLAGNQGENNSTYLFTLRFISL